MKFTISSSALYSRLTAASKVIASKNSMPILDCFLFNLRDNRLTVTASDSEKYFITGMDLIDLTDEAMFCVPARTIMESIKELAEQPINFEYINDTHELLGFHQSGSFSIMTKDAEPFPLQQDINPEATMLKMSAETLVNGINRTIFATATDEIRLVMTGIYIDIRPDHIIFAGTDGRKLVRNIVHTVQPGFEGGLILPKKVATIIKAVLAKNETDVVINFDSEKAIIQTPDFELHFRLIEGRYPNYNAVIPTNNPFWGTVDRAALIGALKRIGVFCNQSSSLMKVHLENNLMKLSGQDNDFATSAEENLYCEYNNAPISVGFSCQFMLEIATVLEDAQLTLELADPSRPGVIVPAEQPEGEEILMLLMPMMLNE
ncbi:MAG: DNA polymerase III subunit beta [Bacteroidales bacterium]|nr:DNA polymerase III subunit beta [Candidatus Physcousia equi]